MKKSHDKKPSAPLYVSHHIISSYVPLAGESFLNIYISNAKLQVLYSLNGLAVAALLLAAGNNQKELQKLSSSSAAFASVLKKMQQAGILTTHADSSFTFKLKAAHLKTIQKFLNAKTGSLKKIELASSIEDDAEFASFAGSSFCGCSPPYPTMSGTSSGSAGCF